jgi:hypothetical protein
MWDNKPGAIYGRELNKVSRGWKKWRSTRTEYLLGNLKKRGHTENPEDGLRCHDVQYIWLNLFSNMRTKGIWAWCFGKWKILYYWRGLGGCEAVESCRWIMFRGGGSLFLTNACTSPPHGATAPSGPGPPHFRGLTITLRHTTLGRTALDEWWAWRRDLYLTTQHSLTRQRHPCPRRDSSPQSQQANGRSPKPP